MSDVQVSYADLSNLTNAINRTANAVANLQVQTTQIGNNIVTVNNNVALVDRKVNQVDNQLADLRQRFILMVKEQRKSAALQRALTEVIRIRQELEQKFGNQQLVRNTMLGILQATDLSIVRNETIANVSEELMISTPKYWLAPCVVALSAWIADKKDLANKALEEALRRDAERTCLLFALICRRASETDKNNNPDPKGIRNQACLTWLKAYFQMQKATAMRRSILTYINAYVNGVFGEDKKDANGKTMLDNYIADWMNELAENGTLAADQAAYWANFYERRCKDIHEQYPTLVKVCPEFEAINAYVRRVNACDGIIAHFERLASAPVDRGDLAEKIDAELMNLVSLYDGKEEEDLRDEEELMLKIKETKGDEAYAQAYMKFKKALKADPEIDFAKQLAQAIDEDNAATAKNMASARKVSFIFLSQYIGTAFQKFITDKKGDFPELINIKVEDWRGVSKDASEKATLEKSYTDHVNTFREKELSNVKGKIPKNFILIAVVAAIVGLIGFAIHVAVALIGLAAAVVVFIIGLNKKKQVEQAQKDAINAKYDDRINKGKAVINKALAEWAAILKIVHNFDPKDVSTIEVKMLKEGK